MLKNKANRKQVCVNERRIDMNWKNWKIGDKIKWSTNDFDGKTETIGVLTKMDEDHAIVEADGMHLWVDDDTCENFTKEGR